MRKNRQEYIDGAAAIVKKYLKLESEEKFLIVFDNTTKQFAEYVDEAAKKSMVDSNTFHCSNKVQKSIKLPDDLPHELRRMILDASCILNLVSSDDDCTAFRRSLIKKEQKVGTRIAHVPGLDIKYLATVFRADFDEMKKWNTIFVRMLHFAKSCKIVTYSSKVEHVLNLNLGGVERPPAQSGIVRDGSWCNIPGSEVYIAPIENHAYGSIVINGSMLDNILDHDVIIQFQNGVISNWETSSPKLRRVLNSFEVKNKDKQDWNALCEFGIGLNDMFKRLTGLQLLDEKARETIHIAIGDSSTFGGELNSDVHQDFVTQNPIVYIDDKLVINKGKFVVSDDDCYEKLDEFSGFVKEYKNKHFKLLPTPTITQDSRIGIHYSDARSQDFFMQIGNDECSQKVLEFIESLNNVKDQEAVYSFNTFEKKYGDLASILKIAIRYGIIEVID